MKYLLLLGVGLGLLWLATRKEDPAEIWEKMVVADPFWLGASIVIALLAFISRAVRWILLMEPLGFKPKLSNTLYALWVGYFANLLVPRIGEITRCGTLARVEKVPFNSLIGTVIVERVIDLIMLFFTMFLVAVLEFEMLKSFILEEIIIPLQSRLDFNNTILIIIFGIIFMIVVFFVIRKLNKKTETESPLKIKIRGFIQEVGQGFKTISKMKKNGWFIFHTFFIWFLYFLMTWVCFFCLESTAHLEGKAALFILVVGGVGMAIPVQGGIGAYHYIVSKGLQLFDVSSADGIAYAYLVHSTQTLLVVVLGLFGMLMLFLVRKKKEANG